MQRSKRLLAGTHPYDNLVPLVVIVLGCSFGSALAAPYNPDAWWTMASGTISNLRAVWGTGPNNVYAVGDQGTVLHFDGQTWSAEASGTTIALNGIWGSGPQDIFAVGSDGTIIHRDSQGWAPMTSGTTWYLRRVWGSGPSNVYVTNDHGTLLHYNGQAWSSGATTGPSYAIWGSASNDIYVTCDVLIWHFNGFAWSSANSGITGVQNYVSGIWGSSSTNIMAVFCGGGVVHSSGSGWSSMLGTMFRMQAIWGSGASNVFVLCNGSMIDRYDGTYWTSMQSNMGACLSGIWGSGPSDVFAVGNTGTIVHYALPGAVQFSATTYDVNRDGIATITITRTGGSAPDAQVNYATSDGTAMAGSNYTAVSDTMTFGLNETSKTFVVPLHAPAAVYGDRTVILTLSDPAGGAALGDPHAAVLTIKENRPMPQVTVEDASGSSEYLSFAVRLSAACEWPVTVDYTTVDGTAIAGTDYTAASGTVTIPAGTTLSLIPATIATATAGNPTKTFTLSLSNAAGATLVTTQAMGEILPPSVPPKGCGQSVGFGNMVAFYVLGWVGLACMGYRPLGRRSR